MFHWVGVTLSHLWYETKKTNVWFFFFVLCFFFQIFSHIQDPNLSIKRLSMDISFRIVLCSLHRHQSNNHSKHLHSKIILKLPLHSSHRAKANIWKVSESQNQTINHLKCEWRNCAFIFFLEFILNSSICEIEYGRRRFKAFNRCCLGRNCSSKYTSEKWCRSFDSSSINGSWHNG